MRSLILLSSMVAVASAEPLTPTVEPRTLPAPCRTVAEVPRDAETLTVHLDATISAANCQAQVNLHALKLSATQASVDAIDTAIAPSIQMLDSVVQTGDVSAQVIAQHAIGDIYQGAAVAMRSVGGKDGDALVGRWVLKAQAAFSESARLGAQIPDRVATDPVLAFAVSDSKFELAPR
ncbi:MAG: hypothetical protein JO257_37620 [Deltaproteobacteria bacterium]|nr:hypothetical protein [Deltaproteobacteria bacterium]